MTPIMITNYIFVFLMGCSLTLNTVIAILLYNGFFNKNS
jgi:hypothetical protein